MCFVFLFIFVTKRLQALQLDWKSLNGGTITVKKQRKVKKMPQPIQEAQYSKTLGSIYIHSVQGPISKGKLILLVSLMSI